VALKIKILEQSIVQPLVSVEKHEYEAVNYHTYLLHEAGTTLSFLPVTGFCSSTLKQISGRNIVQRDESSPVSVPLHHIPAFPSHATFFYATFQVVLPLLTSATVEYYYYTLQVCALSFFFWARCTALCTRVASLICLLSAETNVRQRLAVGFQTPRDGVTTTVTH